MFEHNHQSVQHSTFLTSVVPVAVELPIHEAPYTPSLLLPLPALSSALLCNHEFVDACQFGYDDYFDEMVDENLVFVHKQHSYQEICEFVVEELFAVHVDIAPLAFRVGFLFGWLSALAKYDYSMATTAVLYLVLLVSKGFAHS